MPLTSRDYQHVAAQRLTTAEFLIDNGGNTLDAYYLTGYAIECSLKALILHLTPETEREAKYERISRGHRSHLFDFLAGELRDLGLSLPVDLAKRFARFPWSTALRYEVGRKPTGEAKGFLKTAVFVRKWVEEQLP